MLGLALVTAVGAACGGGDDEADEPVGQPTTTEVSTTLTQAQQDEAEIRQLAQDWFEAVRSVARGEAEVAIFADLAIDPLLADISERIEDRAEGEVSREDSRSRTEVLSIEVDGDVATVVACVVNADVVLDVDGEVLNDEVVARRNQSIVRRTADGWRMADLETLSTTEGETCDES